VKTVDRHLSLDAARRLDWRFLLPSPLLGRVGCAGRLDPALLHALDTAAGPVWTTDRAGTTSAEATCDVIVLAAPTRAELVGLIQLLRPGGWLYLELQGAFSVRGRMGGRLRRARAHRATLRLHGFDNVAMHWHWPGFAMSKWIAPLDDPTVVRRALERHRGGVWARLLERLGRLLLRVHLLATFAPAVSIIAHRPGGRTGDTG